MTIPSQAAFLAKEAAAAKAKAKTKDPDDSDASIDLAGETDDDDDDAVGLRTSMGSVGSIGSSPGSQKGRVSGLTAGVVKPKSAFALAAESDDEDDGAVFADVKARGATMTRRLPVADGKPRPAFKFDDEPSKAAPAKSVLKAPPPPSLPIDDEDAFEIEDDLDLEESLDVEDAW